MKYLTYLGLLIFVYILYSLDYNVVIENLKNINFCYLLFAFILNIPMVYFKSFRWQQILKIQTLNIGANSSFKYYMSSLYLGFITPGRIGEFIRVLYIKEEKQSREYGTIFSTVILDRLFDLYLLILLTILGFSYLQLGIASEYILAITFVFFILPLIIIKLDFFNLLIKSIGTKLSKSFQEKASRFIKSFVKGIKLSLNLYSIGSFSIYTILSYVIFFSQAYLIAMSLNIEINFIVLSLVMAISNTISLLPISISGIGTRDLVLIYFLVPLGITQESAVLYSTLVLITFFVGCALIGSIFYFQKPISLMKSNEYNKEKI